MAMISIGVAAPHRGVAARVLWSFAGHGKRACCGEAAVAGIDRRPAGTTTLRFRLGDRAEAVATDLRYGTPFVPRVAVSDGDYGDLAGSALVMITAGVNEKTGGATDRSDP